MYTAPGLAPAGVWGSPPASDLGGGGGLDEEQLQAQAWLPPTMAELLKQAQPVVACASDEGLTGDLDSHGGCINVFVCLGFSIPQSKPY